MKRTDKRKIIIKILIALIILAVGVVSYIFIIKPAINGYVVNEYNQGVKDGTTRAVIYTMQEALKCKPVLLYVGDFNMSVIWIDCLTNPVNFVESTNQTQSK